MWNTRSMSTSQSRENNNNKLTILCLRNVSRALIGDTLWPPNRTFNAPRSIFFSNFKYSYQPENAKRNFDKHYKEVFFFFQSRILD